MANTVFWIYRKEGVFTDSECRKILEQTRWRRGRFQCPHSDCGHPECWLGQNGSRRCKKCRRHISVTSGTIFHGSHLHLSEWFNLAYDIIYYPTFQPTALDLFRWHQSRSKKPGNYEAVLRAVHLINQTFSDHLWNTKLRGSVAAKVYQILSARLLNRAAVVGIAARFSTTGKIENLRIEILKHKSHEALEKFINRTVDTKKARLRIGRIKQDRIDQLLKKLERHLHRLHRGKPSRHLQSDIDAFVFRFLYGRRLARQATDASRLCGFRLFLASAVSRDTGDDDQNAQNSL